MTRNSLLYTEALREEEAGVYEKPEGVKQRGESVLVPRRPLDHDASVLK